MNGYKLKFVISPEEYKKKFVFLKAEAKFVYEDGKKTDKYDAFTLTFLGENEDVLKVHINKDKFTPLKRLTEYYIEFDDEKTRPYTQNGYVKYSVWAKQIKKGDE